VVVIKYSTLVKVKALLHNLIEIWVISLISAVLFVVLNNILFQSEAFWDATKFAIKVECYGLIITCLLSCSCDHVCYRFWRVLDDGR
jgi:hypothetical protein